MVAGATRAMVVQPEGVAIAHLRRGATRLSRISGLQLLLCVGRGLNRRL